MQQALGEALRAFKREWNEFCFLLQFLPQEVDDRQEGSPGKMGETSPDRTDCRSGRSPCGRGGAQRAFHAQEGEATSGLGDAGSQEEFRGGRWVGDGLEGQIGFVAGLSG